MAAYRIAVLASGGGSNLHTLLTRIQSRELPVTIAFVMANNSQAGALAHACHFNIPAYHVSAKTEGNEEGVTQKLLALLKAQPVDLLVLAGYMKKVPEAILKHLKNRVLNIHPALLPAFGGEGFYGHKVHEALVLRGCQYAGLTIHMVNGDYDAGQIILQKAIPISPHNTAEEVGAAVLVEEHACYWQVIRAFAEGKIIPTDSLEAKQAVNISAFLADIRALQNQKN